MKILLICTFLILSSLPVIGQKDNFLVTIENKEMVKKLTNSFHNLTIEIAFPTSKKNLFKNVYRITVEKDKTNTLLSYLYKYDAFKQIEKEQEIETLEIPNDYNTIFGNDYALNLINAFDAWEHTKGDSNITIGISDANYDLNHEELAGEYVTNVNNFYHSNINHGTAVAITVSGKTNNSLGKSAIGYNTKMMLENMSYSGLLNLSYAGVKVINASWASGCTHNSYHQQIINEIYENGTIIVAAAGNGSTCGGPESLVYPAAYEHVISVSSIGPNDNHERFSGDIHSTHQHNDSVTLVAPGYDVALGIAYNNYTTGNGTSFAAPFVSGTIGLMLSVNPCLTYAEIVKILSETAVDIYPQNSIYTGLLGAGRLNAAAAVEMAKDYAPFTFEMTSEYSCIDDQYTLNIIPGASNVESTIVWGNGSTEWSLKDQPEGAYEFIIKRPFGCDIDTTVYYIPNQPIYDYNSSVILNYMHTTLHDLNGDGVIRIKGLLIVESGVTYNLTNKTIEFGYNDDMPSNLGYQHSGIVVKPGGKLTIDNCQFNAVENCNIEWDGIELWGSFEDTIVSPTEQIQSKSTEYKTSELTLLNSSISNAKVGIRNYRQHVVFGASPLQKEVCGTVTIINAVFNNNATGIHLNEHHNNQPNHVIENTEFNSESQLGATHLRLNNITNIDVAQTTFKGNDAVHYLDQGTGIIAKNSSINAEKAYKTTLQQTYNKFEDLFEGMHIKNSNSSKTAFIGSDNFSKVHRAIYVNGNINTVINSTIFNQPIGTESENSFAVMTTHTNLLKITDNTINGAIDTGSSFGFVFKNNYDNSVIVKGNNFNAKLKAAIQFEGINNTVDLSCNSFDIEGEYDLTIAEGGVLVLDQLSLNSFSSCDKIISNITNDLNNSTVTYTTSTIDKPNCISAGVIINLNDEHISIQNTCDYKFNISRTDETNEDDFEYLTLEESPQNAIAVNHISEQLTEEKTQDNTNMIVYPNPTQDQFTIKTQGVKKIQQIIISNQMGAVVKSQKLAQETDTFKVEGLHSGAYSICIKNKDGSLNYGKVIIL